MTKAKLYDPNEINSFAMQFGLGLAPKSKYAEKKKYNYEDKSTKKHGAQSIELLKENK